jgi:tetratricopeptide (TPR) repeat protein
MSSPAPEPTIQVYDKYGREFQVSREHWRKDVLPAALKSNWDSADALYGAILQALNDDFVAEVAEATARLNELEPESARSATALAFVKMRQGHLDDAQRLLEGYVDKHGPEGVVLNNLAKVYAERGDNDRVERTLWRSLEADPNHENSLGWFEALHRERGGSAAAIDALRRVAALPNAWRARIGLARHALDSRDLPGAMALYNEALRMVGADIPADTLMTITGDLGKRGFLAQALEIGAPRFSPAQHGVLVGNNLIKAYIDSGKLAEARALVEQLYAFNRQDWKSSLSFWDGQLVQAETSRDVPIGSTIEMTMYVIEGPVWAHAGSPIAKIFPAPAEGAPRVVFMGSTAETANAPATPHVQISDAAGRLSRMIPLYLLEQAQLHSGARTRALFPWMLNRSGGSFVLMTEAPSDADALQRAKAGGACDFVVVTHVKANRDPWTATMRVVRASDGKCVFHHETAATPDRLDIIAAALAIEIQRVLEQHAGLKMRNSPDYLPPAPPHLAHYLLRLEQLLAIRCADSPTALHGVREIIEGCLHLCLDFPASVTVRALLADVIARMRNIRPDVIAQYQDRLELLQKEHPLAEPAQSTLAILFGSA